MISDLNGLFKAKFKKLCNLNLYRNQFEREQITPFILKIFPKLKDLIY